MKTELIKHYKDIPSYTAVHAGYYWSVMRNESSILSLLFIAA